MDRNRFIQCMKSNIELSDKERRRIIRRSVESQPWKLKCTIAMEEFAELTQAISKQIRGYDNRIGLLEEMSKEIKIAGSISFGGKRLNVYGDLDAPLFKAKDISHAIGYSSGNEWRMLEMCEEDEKLKLPLVVAGQRRSVNFVTENGLYNILAQSRMEIARSWRRVVHDELINMRKEKGRNIAEQFEEWDRAMDNIYFDEETGQLMQSVTVPGGDVIQIPYEKEEE